MVVALSIASIVFLAMSGHTLYQFPVPDSYRWYGDETWLLLTWKNLLVHGRTIVPAAMQTDLMRSPSLILGSSWLTALCYGLPQLVISPQIDPITIGRTVSFILALLTIGAIAYFGYKLQLFPSIIAICIALLVTTRTFTFASHSARYDMITGFAIMAFISFCAVRIHRLGGSSREASSTSSFWFGVVALFAGMTISPHAGGLLILPSLFIAWYFGIFRSISNFIFAIMGAILSGALLIAIYHFTTHNVSTFGIANGNSVNSSLHHLPISHLFSWSAQRDQLGAKLYDLWHDAPAFVFVLPLIFISEIVLSLQQRPHPVCRFLTCSLALILIGSAFFQGTLPYYIVYFAPLAALTIAAQAMEWSKTEWLLPLVTVGSLVLMFEMLWIWLPELSNAGRLGVRINESNAAAVQAAMEEASRTWQPGVKPLVLAQRPALHELLRDTNIRVMNESFLLSRLRDAGESADSEIAQTGVNYILDYHKAKEYPANAWNGTPIFIRVGPLLDRSVNYFHDTSSELDTLILYEMKSP